MASHDYRNECNVTNKLKLNNLLKQLPLFCNTYFKHLESKGAEATTQLGYAVDLMQFFKYMTKSAGFKGISIDTFTIDMLDKITSQDIREYLLDTQIYVNKYGKTVVVGEERNKRKISCLKSFYGFYFKEELINTNPMVRIDIPKQHRKEIVTLSHDEISQILNYINNDNSSSKQKKAAHEKTRSRDLAIITTLLGTGIRISELVGLNVGDVDFNECCLKIVRKGGDDDIVYFGEDVEIALKNYLESDRELFHPNPDDAMALFLSLHHNRIGVRAIEVMVKRYCSELGINKKITPHKMRSTFGTNLYAETGDIYLVAEVLGHNSVETTKKHYAAMNQEHKRKAAKAANNLFKATKDAEN